MLGAIIGDYVGSPYEYNCNNIKTQDFPFFGDRCTFTDDSVMTLAIAEALMDAIENDTGIQEECVKSMQKWGREYPNAGYGTRFRNWIWSNHPEPYNSWGNGSAMRVSPVGWLFDSLEKTEQVAGLTAAVTHDHEEGVRGAQAVAAAIFLARTGATKAQIKTLVEERYGYDLSKTLDSIRPAYHHVESCQKTVPVSIIAFLESHDFEDAIRKAVSVGGDSDTVACITGSIAEAYYGVPKDMRHFVLDRLPKNLAKVTKRWHKSLNDLRKVAAQLDFSAPQGITPEQLHALQLWTTGALYQANRALGGKDPNPPKTTVAKKSDWVANPMPDKTIRFSIFMPLRDEEYATLIMGHVPEEMEDKWFYYFDSDSSAMYFHRSWTGNCIFIAYIKHVQGGYVVTDVIANQDPAQHTQTDVVALQALVSLLIAQDVGRDASIYYSFV